MTITLQELDSKLFNCADVLRGSIDSGRYKDFVLPLVFYATIDGWYTQELNNKAQDKENCNYNQLTENQDFFRRQAERELGVKIPQGHSWNQLVQTNENIASEIDNTFTEFERENSNNYSGLFNNNFTAIDSFKGQDGDKLLKQLLREIDQVDFSEVPPDLMGEAYMNLVKRFSEAEGGEYFTPPRIVDLVVKLLEPFEKGVSIHDPTAGSGGMLTEVSKHIKEQYKHEFQDEEDNTVNQQLQEFIETNFEFTGQEKNPTIAGISKMNLALHGIKGTIKQGDSLTNPQFTEDENTLEKFDYILANFPFSTSGWKSGTQERQERFGDLNWAEDGDLPHGNYGDFAFIMHMFSQLEDQGQLATIIPHGILFRNGDQKYRKYLIENDLVEAVIGLPENLFEATGIPSGILVLNKNKPEERKGEVMFFNADHEDRFFYDTGSSRTRLLDEGSQEIKQFYQNWQEEDRVARIVSTEEIQDNEYNMNIALYVDTTEPQDNINVSETLTQVRNLEQEYNQLNQQLTQYMRQLEYEGDQ